MQVEVPIAYSLVKVKFLEFLAKADLDFLRQLLLMYSHEVKTVIVPQYQRKQCLGFS